MGRSTSNVIQAGAVTPTIPGGMAALAKPMTCLAHNPNMSISYGNNCYFKDPSTTGQWIEVLGSNKIMGSSGSASYYQYNSSYFSIIRVYNDAGTTLYSPSIGTLTYQYNYFSNVYYDHLEDYFYFISTANNGSNTYYYALYKYRVGGTATQVATFNIYAPNSSNTLLYNSGTLASFADCAFFRPIPGAGNPFKLLITSSNTYFYEYTIPSDGTFSGITLTTKQVDMYSRFVSTSYPTSSTYYSAPYNYITRDNLYISVISEGNAFHSDNTTYNSKYDIASLQSNVRLEIFNPTTFKKAVIYNNEQLNSLLFIEFPTAFSNLFYNTYSGILNKLYPIVLGDSIHFMSQFYMLYGGSSYQPTRVVNSFNRTDFDRYIKDIAMLYGIMS